MDISRRAWLVGSLAAAVMVVPGRAAAKATVTVYKSPG
jgi:hypothetical protein